MWHSRIFISVRANSKNGPLSKLGYVKPTYRRINCVLFTLWLIWDCHLYSVNKMVNKGFFIVHNWFLLPFATYNHQQKKHFK